MNIVKKEEKCSQPARPKEMNMNTSQNELPSYREHPGLFPGHSLFSLTGGGLESVSRGSQTPFAATREVGLRVFEIFAAADRIREAYAAGDMESLRERLSFLTSITTNCSMTLSNIIESAKMESGPGEMICERFDVVALLHEVAQTARLIAGDKPVRVMDASLPCPHFILSDRAKIRLIMTEIAGNAAKFTERGRVALILNKDVDRIWLTVTDTGMGMTEEQVRAFSASSDRIQERTVNGTSMAGRGLNLVMNLVALLKGGISISSKLGEGTIVEVSLPLKSF
jgi:signal transduction histidine kinase